MGTFPAIYPNLSLVLNLDAYTRGPLQGGAPRGATLHYTADGSAEAAVKSYALSGYAYHLIVDRDGKVIQTASCTKAVWHAGKAVWRGLSPNRTCLAIAVVSWGALEPDGKGGWQSWAGTPVPAAEVAMRKGLDGEERAWHAATPAQEESLLHVLRWAVALGVSPDEVHGHDECALPLGRKIDMGGVYSKTMPELRALLANKP